MICILTQIMFAGSPKEIPHVNLIQQKI